jgi:hypothetical protein
LNQVRLPLRLKLGSWLPSSLSLPNASKQSLQVFAIRLPSCCNITTLVLARIKSADVTQPATLCEALAIRVHKRRLSPHSGHLIAVLTLLQAESLALQP